MSRANLTFPTGLVLQAITRGHRYGFEIIDISGLNAGTVYPALRRLEGAGFLTSDWEDGADADAQGRPPRCYYRLTASGVDLLSRTIKRFPVLAVSFAAEAPPEPEGA